MIKKAIFPVGGLGTRFLPATKALPKEMLTVVDKPLIQYAVEEAAVAGIEEFVFVTGRNKSAIEDHFDHSYELEKTLIARGKTDALAMVHDIIYKPGSVSYVRQQEPVGLGHAVWCARNMIHNEPVAILLADDLIINDPSATQQLINVAQKTNSSVIGLNKVPKEHISRYGVISSADASKEEKLFLLDGIIEKPHSNPPSDMAVFGRYVLSHHIFNYLERIDPGVGGEIQLTDAIKLMLKEYEVNGYLYDGVKFDCGSKEGYVQAIAHLASDLLSK